MLTKEEFSKLHHIDVRTCSRWFETGRALPFYIKGKCYVTAVVNEDN